MLIGIVGKPNVGKSTFFKAATLAEVEIGNRPFVTIEPNEGVGFVRTECAEKHFGVKCQPAKGFCIDGNRFVPIKLLDVAGLVPGAHEGKGLGVKFLDDLASADVLIHVLDAAGATNEKGEPVKAGSYDPLNDVRFLENEIDMWFFGIMKDNWYKFARKAEMESEDAFIAIANQFSGLKINLSMVKSAVTKLGLSKELTSWTDENLKKFASELRKSSKPIIIAANKIDLETAGENIKRIKNEFPNLIVVPCSAESELALREAAKADLIKYIPGSDNFDVLKADILTAKQTAALNFVKERILSKWKSTGVQDCLNIAVFDLLKYFVVSPGGVHKLADSKGRILPDAFLFPPGSTAFDFASKIHTDLAEGFIKAIDVKTGRALGKESPLKHGDVIEIVSRN